MQRLCVAPFTFLERIVQSKIGVKDSMNYVLIGPNEEQRPVFVSKVTAFRQHRLRQVAAAEPHQRKSKTLRSTIEITILFVFVPSIAFNSVERLGRRMCFNEPFVKSSWFRVLMPQHAAFVDVELGKQKELHEPVLFGLLTPHCRPSLRSWCFQAVHRRALVLCHCHPNGRFREECLLPMGCQQARRRTGEERRTMLVTRRHLAFRVVTNDIQ